MVTLFPEEINPISIKEQMKISCTYFTQINDVLAATVRAVQSLRYIFLIVRLRVYKPKT